VYLNFVNTSDYYSNDLLKVTVLADRWNISGIETSCWMVGNIEYCEPMI